MSQAPALPETTRQQMLRRLLEIRLSEENIQGLFLQNLVRGTTHLCIGQEATSVGMAWALQKGDTVTCTYRGHGHALAMGVSIKALMAEMMGKASGVNGGRGGSMHMTDPSLGLLGANAIVGAQLPIALGAAFSAQVLGEPRASIGIFGDGAANIGAVHESLNMAAVWRLPVLFICENNLYGEYSPLETTTAIENIADRACAYGIRSEIVDGQDVEVVYHAMKDALDYARKGHGPVLMEWKTYRFRGHSRTDQAPYRKPGELDEWMQRDPLIILKERMIADGQLDETEYAELHESIEKTVLNAIEWAKNEPYPALDTLNDHIYYPG
ncbi:MAG: thiamine pyrophosphate-dependent dehydrogenase E1 component subunit alpha [Anaerolineales bacterium]